MEFFIKLLAHSSKLPFGGDRKHKYCVMPFACFGGSAKPRHPKQHACFLTKTTVPSEPGWWTITSPLAPSFSRTGLPGAGLGPRLRSDDVRGPPPPPRRLRSAALGLVPGRAAVYGGRLLGQRATGSASLAEELPTRFSAR